MRTRRGGGGGYVDAVPSSSAAPAQLPGPRPGRADGRPVQRRSVGQRVRRLASRELENRKRLVTAEEEHRTT